MDISGGSSIILDGSQQFQLVAQNQELEYCPHCQKWNFNRLDIFSVGSFTLLAEFEYDLRSILVRETNSM